MNQLLGSGTLIAYTSRGRFDSTTLKKLLVIWLVWQSLPWSQIKDFLMGWWKVTSFIYFLLNLSIY
jgi:hypothetical protein